MDGIKLKTTGEAPSPPVGKGGGAGMTRPPLTAPVVPPTVMPTVAHPDPADRDAVIRWAQRMLAQPDAAVLLDLATLWSRLPEDIVQLVLVDLHGEVLLDTLVRPKRFSSAAQPMPVPAQTAAGMVEEAAMPLPHAGQPAADGDTPPADNLPMAVPLSEAETLPRLVPTAVAVHGVTRTILEDTPTLDALLPHLARLTRGKAILTCAPEIEATMLPRLPDAPKDAPRVWYCVPTEYTRFLGAVELNTKALRPPSVPGAGPGLLAECLASLKLLRQMAAATPVPRPRGCGCSGAVLLVLGVLLAVLCCLLG